MLRGLNSPIEWCVVRSQRRFTCHVKIHRYIHTRHGASSLNLLLQNTIIVILPRECSVGYTGIRGICGGRTQLTESQVRVLRSCRTYQSVRYQYRVCTKPYRSVRQDIELGTEQIPVPPVVLWSRVYRYPVYTWVSVPNLRICRVSVSRSYRTDTGIQSYRTQQSVRHWYRVCAEVTNVSGTGTELVPNLPIYRLPVSNLHRTYRSVGYSYRHCTQHTEVPGTGIGKKNELTQVSGTGIEAVPN